MTSNPLLQLEMPEDVSDAQYNQTMAELYKQAQSKKESILKRLAEGTEGTIVLTGAIEDITK